MRLGDGRSQPALDLVYYQEAQYSRLLPVTTRRYVTLPVILNGGYFRYPSSVLAKNKCLAVLLGVGGVGLRKPHQSTC